MNMLSLLLLSSAVSLTMALGPMQDDPNATNEKDGPVRHVVAFKYTSDATDDQIAEVTDAFRELRNSIPGIVSFEYGINNSPEGQNDGFTHLYLITFEDEAARDAYLPHPEHEKFGALLGRLGVLEDAFVIDYVPQE